ncbi:MAG: hypothetical protein FJX72_03210 [Armatimonadetes bacterium]|nr:hypothetical protein [Armatimonadota bacterium]
MTQAIPIIATLTALGSVAWAQPVITNPSFEADGAAIKGVGYVGQDNPIAGWRISFPGLVGRNPQDGPFVDNGIIPDGRSVCVLQNLSWIAQSVRGLRTGKVYRLSIRANGRASDAPEFGALSVEMNGSTLISVTQVEPVGKGQPYRTHAAHFTAGTGAADLTIRQTNPKSGVSVLVDDIRIVEASPSAGERIIQVNPASPLTSPTVSGEQDLTDVSWIWTNETHAPAQTAPIGRRHFERTFRVASQPRRAVVTFTADNSCRVFVNGKIAGWGDSLNRLYHTDVTHLIRSGANTLSVEAENGGPERINPAGLILKLVVTHACSKAPIVVVTDGSWRWGMPKQKPTKPVRLAGDMGCSPWQWVGPISQRVSRWFPMYEIPGQERVADAVRRMFSLHVEGGRPQCTLWDGWQSLAGLWPVRGKDLNDDSVAQAWKQVLLSRDISSEGYVATHFHRGFGHSKGWPIPLYMQTGGVGFHFSFAGDPFATWVPKAAEPSEWGTIAIQPVALDRDRGWELGIAGNEATITSPAFDIPMAAAPFVRVEWQVVSGSIGAAQVQWATAEKPAFDGDRSTAFAPVAVRDGMAYSDVPICDSPAWKGTGRMSRLRLTFRGGEGSRIVLKSMITPADTRHNINNPHFVMGSALYLDWTGDLDFLRKNIARMRSAMAFSIKEFRLREALCVDTPWYGHDGRSGFIRNPDGSRTSRWAGGVGNNYWDLLPFGGKDTHATVYHYDALRRMAAVERLIRSHPDWRVPADGPALDPDELEDLAERIKAHAGKLLWNERTGRFAACVDVDGVQHDYGYAIVNLEAIHYGFATPEQARSILAWLDGKRTVEGDTSQGADIYRWRFGPRSTTRRNTDWYSGMWEPLNVPWGDQVQDGGGVLGFSYFDIMARLRTNGPDDAAKRLAAIAKWFDEVQAEGGYRAYYAKPGRGTQQGGGPPGGLLLDYEFVESALVPQVLLYGFLGFRPDPTGFRIEPRLPKAWPSLRVSRVRYHGLVMDVKADRRSIEITVRGGKPTGVVRLVGVPKDWIATVRAAKGQRLSAKQSGDGWVVPVQAGARLVVTARRP